MTVKQVHFTFGPKEILQDLREKHAQRKLVLYRALNAQDRYMLVDYSGQKNIFNGGLTYQVLDQLDFEEPTKQGILELRYLTLDEAEQKIFEKVMLGWQSKAGRPFGLERSLVAKSKKQDYEYLLFNYWVDREDFMDWSNLSTNPLAGFGHAGNKDALVTAYKQID